MLTALTEKLMGILLEINVIPDQLYKFSSAFKKKNFWKNVFRSVCHIHFVGLILQSLAIILYHKVADT